MSTIRKSFAILLAIGVAATCCNQAGAVTLTDLNAQITVDPTSQVGLSEWSISSQNQAHQQWFWQRNSSLIGQNQYSIEVGATLTQTTSGTDKLNLNYNYGGNYTIDIFYDLNGSGSDSSSLIQNVGITNLSASTLVLDFYQYNNFNLGGDPGGDDLYMEANYAWQQDGGLFITEGGIQPPSNFFEANTLNGISGPGSSTLYKLNNSTDLALNTLSGGSSLIGPDDVTWAFQWHIELDPGQGITVIKNQNMLVSLVPEPSSLSLGVLALALLKFGRKSRCS